jgi:hypothetical protein
MEAHLEGNRKPVTEAGFNIRIGDGRAVEPYRESQ